VVAVFGGRPRPGGQWPMLSAAIVAQNRAASVWRLGWPTGKLALPIEIVAMAKRLRAGARNPAIAWRCACRFEIRCFGPWDFTCAWHLVLPLRGAGCIRGGAALWRQLDWHYLGIQTRGWLLLGSAGATSARLRQMPRRRGSRQLTSRRKPDRRRCVRLDRPRHWATSANPKGARKQPPRLRLVLNLPARPLSIW
jgi:hypothetical protein